MLEKGGRFWPPPTPLRATHVRIRYIMLTLIRSAPYRVGLFSKFATNISNFCALFRFFNGFA
jgi:hypothetical protein